jgi:hypothetical protein
MIVRLWCFHTGKLLFCFKGHSQSVRWVWGWIDYCNRQLSDNFTSTSVSGLILPKTTADILWLGSSNS